LTLMAGAKDEVAFGGYDLLKNVAPEDVDNVITQQLKAIVDNVTPASAGVIVYTEKGHFITVKGVNSANQQLTIIDHGEERTLSYDDFKDIWSGKIICEEQAVINAGLVLELENKRLSVIEMRRTVGAGWNPFSWVKKQIKRFFKSVGRIAKSIGKAFVKLFKSIGNAIKKAIQSVAKAIGVIGLIVLVIISAGTLGPMLMGAGSSIMGFGAGMIGTGLGMMATGLAGFIVGAAMVVIGAAVWAVGAVIWAA
ncbi:unnamed protein product, partial [marine sediment metagenome]